MHVGPFLEEDEGTTERTLDVNVRGVLHGMKIALPRFRARGRGHLVNVASTAGRVGYPGGAVYCGSKFFVIGASEAVRNELHGSGVDVSCVMPGIVNTELTSGLPRPVGVRAIEPEDVAEAIVGALRRPRFDVYVPRSLGWALHGSVLFPRRAREGLARALRWDRFLLDNDRVARSAYERRVAASGR
jgi:short-subunit dehydrogenase